MSNDSTAAVSTPAATRPTNTRPGRGYEAQPQVARSAKPSRKRTTLATLGAAAALAIGITGFAGVGQAQAADYSPAKVKAMEAVTAKPGAIRTPSGKLRCTKPGQYHVAVKVPVTTKGRNSIRSAALWLQPSFHGDPMLIGRAKSKSSTVTVIGCFSPAQVQGLKRGPAYLIAADVLDGHTNVVRVRVSR